MKILRYIYTGSLRMCFECFAIGGHEDWCTKCE